MDQENYTNQAENTQEPLEGTVETPHVQPQKPVYYDQQIIDMNAPDDGKKGFAIAALVLGIVGFIIGCCVPFVGFICGILGVVFGIIGLKSTGKGMAIAGIVLGALTLLVSIGFMLFIGAFMMLGF